MNQKITPSEFTEQLINHITTFEILVSYGEEETRTFDMWFKLFQHYLAGMVDK